LLFCYNQIMFKQQDKDCYFDLQVKPNSKRVSLKVKKGIVHLSVTNPPVKNQANKEIVKILSELFKKKVEIHKSMPGYKKIIKINDMDVEEAKKILGVK
jgi:uncharacterized protein (TIGR00251 family)